MGNVRLMEQNEVKSDDVRHLLPGVVVGVGLPIVYMRSDGVAVLGRIVGAFVSTCKCGSVTPYAQIELTHHDRDDRRQLLTVDAAEVQS